MLVSRQTFMLIVFGQCCNIRGMTQLVRECACVPVPFPVDVNDRLTEVICVCQLTGAEIAV